MKAWRVRRNPWITAASCIPWALVPVLIVASILTGAPYAALSPHLTIAGALVFASVWRRKPRAILDPVEVDADDATLRIGSTVVPRSAVKNAETMPAVNGTSVRIALRGRLNEHVLVKDDETAHAVLKKLGFDPSQTTASYRIASMIASRYRYAPFLFFPVAMLAAFVSAGLHTHGPTLVPFVFLLMLPMFLTPTKLVVGVDGLLLRWLWVREFIPTKDIVYVRRYDDGYGRNRRRGVELALPGRMLKLPMYSDEQIATIETRIRDVVRLAHSSTHVDEGALVLSRGELEWREWIARLKALGAGETATLRSAAIPPEQLWRVAEDPAQPALARAAAAVAVGTTDRLRLAEVAKTTAAPKLRIALERAAEGASDEEMEEALRELEA